MKTLEPFVRQWATLLTTYRRDGTPVGTPVSIVVEGDHAYFRTWATSGKMKRIRNNPEVEVAPSTALGKQTGPAIWGRVRLLKGDEATHAARLLSRKHPVMQRFLVPMAHRLRGYETVHLELIPLDNLAADGTKEGAA
ncbi:MAG: PPOX class F420-dependent oxidoreductase [Rubrobacteraceae bacterium]